MVSQPPYLSRGGGLDEAGTMGAAGPSLLDHGLLRDNDWWESGGQGKVRRWRGRRIGQRQGLLHHCVSGEWRVVLAVAGNGLGGDSGRG